jgi:hypothetical protein
MSLGTRGNDASAYKTWQFADFFGLRGNASFAPKKGALARG